MEAFVDGEWKKGVAVRLQHGTVVTWDARLIRHCSGLPKLEIDKKTGQPKSTTHGTYFGIDGRISKHLERKQGEKP